MTKDYGIRISRPGFDVQTTSPEELAFSSKYGTLKILTRGSGTLTHTARTVTIPHGLGYVPFFLVHTQLCKSVASTALVGDNTDFFISPFRLGSAIEIWEPENTHDIVAWADTANLYIKARDNVGVDRYPVVTPSVSANENRGYEWSGSGGGTNLGEWWVGNSSGFWDIVYGAVRIRGVDLNKDESIVAADLNLYIGSRQGSGEVKMDIWGIDEDNTVVFTSGTFPTARTKTTAKTDHNFTVGVGQYAGASVKLQVEEIIARSGWSNGNAMGFIMWDDGTSNGNYVGESGSGGNTDVSIVRNSNLVDYKYTIFLNQLE